MMRSFRSNEQGAVFIMAAAGMMALVGAVGAAVDIARTQMVEAKLQAAVDSAGLAAGAALSTSDVTALATKYIQVNFAQGNLGAVLGEVTSTVSANTQIITVHASAEVPMTLVRVFGAATATVSADTEVTRTSKGMELALVLDITGSMWTDNNYLKQREASAALVNILYGNRETVPNLWVSVVPYVTSVNIGSQSRALQWLKDGNDASRVARYPASYPVDQPKWKGCVEERESPADVTDHPPLSGTGAAAIATRWNPFYWASSTADNHWLNGSTVSINEAVNYSNDAGRGPNISCGDSVLALTASKTTVLNKVSGLHPWRKGGTMSNVGLVWGWRMLSPQWRGLWDADLVDGQVKLPMNYHAPLMQKVIVIETDGANNFFKTASSTPPYSDYTAFLRLNTAANGGRADIDTTSNATGIGLLNTKTTAVCEAIKAQGILIYTVTFGLTNSAGDNAIRSIFRNCASKPEYYFDATSNSGGSGNVDLTTAFKTIGDSLANLRISE